MPTPRPDADPGPAEPQPTEAFREQRPDVYDKESKNPVVLCVRAVPE